MAQLFSPRANVHSRVIIVGIVVLVCGAGWATSTIYWSPYTTYVGVTQSRSPACTGISSISPGFFYFLSCI